MMKLSADQPVAVVTGASAGIGKAAARQLVELGWQVIGVGRDAERSASAEREIAVASSEGSFEMLRADLTSMSEVRRLAEQIRAIAPRLDVLINNAGGVRDRQIITSEGTEATFAANHLAPFVLTRELMPLLREAAKTAPPRSVRVIAVASSAHRVSSGMDWADLQSIDNFQATPAYCQAKLANILFTRELARRVSGDGIVALAMHPGVVASNFASHGDANMQAYMSAAQTVSPEEPAETLVWLATSDEAGSSAGEYFYNKTLEVPSDAARDDAAAARLWTQTEAILEDLAH